MAEKADKVEIRWPSGKTEVLENLASDHFYYVKEGEGLVSKEDARPGAQKAVSKPSQAR
jgi:hypothetical protein